MTTNFKTRLLSLIDEYSTDLLIDDDIDVANTPLEVLPTTLSDNPFKDRLGRLIDEYSNNVFDDDDDSIAPLNSEDVQSAVQVYSPDDTLPIYEATAAQIDFWHASIDCANVCLQNILREYDLDFTAVQAFNRFKVGIDYKRHVVTFAVDNTHYYMIQFNKFNSAPIDDNQAQLVLQKINRIRYETHRIENFCGVPIERFD